MVPSWTGSFLDRAGGETADDLAFGEGVEEQAGSIARLVYASTSAKSVVYWEEMLLTPIGSVCLLGSTSTSNGSRNAFQLVTSVITATVLSTGRDSGNITDQ